MAAPSTTVVLSDAHLGAVSVENERALFSFLERVPELGDELLVNGDLFDFWFEYRSVILRRHFQLLRRLADLSDAGIRLRFVGGNHDAWAGSFLSDEIGMELVEGPVVTRVGGRRTYLAHGDGLAGGDLGYRLLKAVIRSRPARTAFRWVHPDLGARIAGTASQTEGKQARGAGPDSAERARRLEDHAERLLREDPSLELVIFGHAHEPCLREVEPGRHYLNAGDWIHHLSYGIVGPEGIELRRWNPR